MSQRLPAFVKHPVTKICRLWLRRRLANNFVHCLKYIVVHKPEHKPLRKPVHVLEPQHHHKRFTALMALRAEHWPDWPQRRAWLKASVLGHKV